MSEITLNIYKEDNKNEVEKTYKADGYDLMLGTVEDFMAILDLDNINNNIEVAKMVVKGYSQIKPLLKDVFPGVTDEELKRVKVPELVNTIIQIGMSIVDSLKELKPGNLTRA